MSKQGINVAAAAFETLQNSRQTLLKMGTTKKPIDKQDLALAQMLSLGKDAMKDRFAQITTEDK